MSPPAHRPVGALASLVAGAAAVCVLAGCGSVGDTLSRRSLSVIFNNDRTSADVARVRSECDGAGGAKALPTGADNATNRRYPLRFDVSGLDQRSVAKLVACLDADPSVRAYQDSESADG